MVKLKWPFGKNEKTVNRTPRKSSRGQISRIGRLRESMSRRDPRFKDAPTDKLIDAVVELIEASAHADAPPGRAFVIESEEGVIAQGVDFSNDKIAVLLLPDGAVTIELNGMSKIRDTLDGQGRVLWYNAPPIAEITNLPPTTASNGSNGQVILDQMPTLPTMPPEADEIAKIELVIEEFVQSNGRTPTKKACAEMMGVSPRSLTRVVSKHGARWLDIVANYEPTTNNKAN